MNDFMFRQLSPEEEVQFRNWARENFEDKEPNLCWHPVVRSEWEKIRKELKK